MMNKVVSKFWNAFVEGRQFSKYRAYSQQGNSLNVEKSTILGYCASLTLRKTYDPIN